MIQTHTPYTGQRRIIQIAAVPASQNAEHGLSVYALDEDGAVWRGVRKRYAEPRSFVWEALPSLPDKP